jgi:hypothetical protein
MCFENERESSGLGFFYLIMEEGELIGGVFIIPLNL